VSRKSLSRCVKIACTLGPATRAPETVRALVESGVDVARLNLAHGTHDEHRALCAAVREAAEGTGRTVAVLADLQGPKIRFGRFAAGPVELAAGALFRITTEEVLGTAERASTTYEALPRDVKPGDTVLVADGLVRLEVVEAGGREVLCRVVDGGPVGDHKGINLPGVAVSAPALTAKDREDLRFALALGADLVALSFVRRAEDVETVRAVMADVGVHVPVIAKIEKPEAVEHLEAIAEAFDGLLVARGDLGVEMPLERVPLVQKDAIRLARERAKPVAVATQMLESMVHEPRPTRAEASDVANAVLDGADVLLLTGETSMGAYPVEAVRTMARIVGAAEAWGLAGLPGLCGHMATPEQAIARAAVGMARDLGARALVAFTQSGATARRLASHRDCIPLLVMTSDPAVRRQLAYTWGVEAFVVPAMVHSDELVARVDRTLLEMGRGAPGDHVVIVAGAPFGVKGATNLIRVHRLGGL
jgi:pyruvate kinase